jgi:hypothetical protein
MATKIVDRDGNRVFTIDANTAGCPGSVFITGPRGFCMEFTMSDLVSGFKKELGIVEVLEVGLDRFLQAAA